MPDVKSYDIGWKITERLYRLHFFRTNDQTKAAVSHCGLLVPKTSLFDTVLMNHCGYCQTVQDTKDKATAAQQQAISPNKSLPVGVQTGKGDKHE